MTKKKHQSTLNDIILDTADKRSKYCFVYCGPEKCDCMKHRDIFDWRNNEF